MRFSLVPSLPGLLTLVAFAASPALVACDSLTTPPTPEPIASATTMAAGASAAAKPPSPPPSAAAAATPTPPMDPNAKLVSTDLVVGKGPEAKTGQTVHVHYVGTLADGKEFDSSRKRGQPFVFTLGKGGVIQGWDLGVQGMKVGGKRKLVIPPQLAYGPGGRPPTIPPAATLTFEIELLDVK